MLIKYNNNKERRNYYRILNVQPDAPLEIIKNNYRTLLQKLRLHPDLGGENRNASIINEAYNVLRNPEKRSAYDQSLLKRYELSSLSRGHLGKPCTNSFTRTNFHKKDQYGIKVISISHGTIIGEYKTFVNNNRGTKSKS